VYIGKWDLKISLEINIIHHLHDLDNPFHCHVYSASLSLQTFLNTLEMLRRFITHQDRCINRRTNHIKNSTFPHKTFVKVLSNVCDTPFSQLPIPTIKDDKFSIFIPDDEYNLGLDECNNNLHARIIWPKGTTLITVFV